jgi:predicted N-acetyltransferase YhbS
MNRFRQATKADECEILSVMSSAFNREPGSPKYLRDESRIRASVSDHYVLEVDGQICGAVHIKSDEIQVGSCAIRKADVGEVSIAAKAQGRGLGTDMMHAVVSTLRQAGYHISRLGGYRKFYQSFGWLPFPRGYIDFALSGLTSRGGFTDPVSYLDRPEEDRNIRPYTTSDAGVCAEIYLKFNAGRTGASPVRSFGSEESSPLEIVYVRDRKVEGYLLASQNARPHTGFSTAISIRDAATDPADLRPLAELIRFTLRKAAISGAPGVSARLPLDPELYDLYRDASTGFVPTLWQSSEGWNMLQVLSFRMLLETILPEL